jgi:hypothetical protein
VQALLLAAEHCTQTPATHAGRAVVAQGSVVPEALSPLQGPQVLVSALQIGALAGQFALVAQTQVPEVALQMGATAEHPSSLVAEHSTHEPLTHARRCDVGHASVAAAPLSPLQPTQVLAVVSQTGAFDGQLELASHPHEWALTRQTGVVPLQAVALVIEHCKHWPPTQAGANAVGQCRALPEPLSPSQAWQMPVAVLQTGAPAGHSELLEHPQVPALVSQLGVMPTQAVALVAEHS